MSKITTAQDNLIALLRADSFFQDNTDPMNPVVKVPIVSKKQGDSNSRLEEQVKSMNLGLIVICRRARRTEVQLGNRVLECQFGLTALVNPTVTRTRVDLPTASDICEAAFNVLEGKLNGVNPNDESEAARFAPDADAIVFTPVPSRPQLDIQLLRINTTIDISP